MAAFLHACATLLPFFTSFFASLNACSFDPRFLPGVSWVTTIRMPVFFRDSITLPLTLEYADAEKNMVLALVRERRNARIDAQGLEQNLNAFAFGKLAICSDMTLGLPYNDFILMFPNPFCSNQSTLKMLEEFASPAPHY